MFRAARTAAAAVLLTAALSACSLIGTGAQPSTAPTATDVAASGQSTEEACAAIYSAFTEVNGRMSIAFATLQTDPEKAASLLHDIGDDLQAAIEPVTNAEVLDAATTFIDSVDRLAADLDDVIAGNPDPDAMLADSKAVNDDYAAFEPICAEATPADQTAKQACDQLYPVVVDTKSRILDAYDRLQSDPTAASPLLHDLSDDLHGVLDRVVNADARDVFSTAIDSIDRMIVEIDKSNAGNPDKKAFDQASADVSTDIAAIYTFCQAQY